MQTESRECNVQVFPVHGRRISVKLDIAVKDGTVKILDILSVFFGGRTLSEKLEVTEFYETIAIVSVGPNDDSRTEPTVVPATQTSEPTRVPTVAPTVLLAT